MQIDVKDILFLVLGVIVGFVSSVAVYWCPLGQFKNEFSAIINLVSKKYNRGDEVFVEPGVDLKPLDSSQLTLTTSSNTVKFSVWHDEGVNWYFTPNGWIRARVLHVFQTNQQSNNLYKLAHTQISKIS